MDEFVKAAVSEGGDAETARMMWRAGMTDSFVKKAKESGLTYQDLEQIWGSFGQNSVPVLIEVVSRIKK